MPTENSVETPPVDLVDSISRLSQNEKHRLYRFLQAECAETDETQLRELQETYTVAAYRQREAMKQQTDHSFPVQFITEADGERIGVVLAWEDYSILRRYAPADPELLAGLNKAELEALADSMLAPTRQNRLSELLRKKREDVIADSEIAELDHTLEQIDQLNLLKARANLTLQQFPEVVEERPELR